MFRCEHITAQQLWRVVSTVQREQQELEVFPNHISWENEKYIKLKTTHTELKKRQAVEMYTYEMKRQ